MKHIIIILICLILIGCSNSVSIESKTFKAFQAQDQNTTFYPPYESNTVIYCWDANEYCHSLEYEDMVEKECDPHGLLMLVTCHREVWYGFDSRKILTQEDVNNFCIINGYSYGEVNNIKDSLPNEIICYK